MKHILLDAFATLEGRRFQMSAIRIEKNHFLSLKFVCCINSFKLCPLVGEKLLFERKLVSLVIDVVDNLESFGSIPSHATVF